MRQMKKEQVRVKGHKCVKKIIYFRLKVICVMFKSSQVTFIYIVLLRLLQSSFTGITGK